MPRAAGGRAEKLRSLVRLLSESAEIVISEWEKEELAADTSSRDTLAGADLPRLPSPTLFEARRVFVGACGMGMDLVQDPIQRLTVLAASFFDSRALRIAAEGRIADALEGIEAREGMPADDIAAQVGIPTQQLSGLITYECGSQSRLRPSVYSVRSPVPMFSPCFR